MTTTSILIILFIVGSALGLSLYYGINVKSPGTSLPSQGGGDGETPTPGTGDTTTTPAPTTEPPQTSGPTSAPTTGPTLVEVTTSTTIETVLIVLIIGVVISLLIYSYWDKVRGLVNIKKSEEAIKESVEQAKEGSLKVAEVVPVIEAEAFVDANEAKGTEPKDAK